MRWTIRRPQWANYWLAKFDTEAGAGSTVDHRFSGGRPFKRSLTGVLIPGGRRTTGSADMAQQLLHGQRAGPVQVVMVVNIEGAKGLVANLLGQPLAGVVVVGTDKVQIDDGTAACGQNLVIHVHGH